MKKEKQKSSRKGKGRPPRGAAAVKGKYQSRIYPAEIRLAAVKLHLEEGYKLDLVAEQMGLNRDTVWKWVRRYREEGRAGLERFSGRAKGSKPRLPSAVHEQIVEVKKEHPGFGIRRIAQWLRLTRALPASPETVRQTLHRHKLLPKTKPHKRPRNPPKPRFFERATPMQMWQSDICTVRINGKNAYLIGFMDDHSRYLVGLNIYRSQTTENVLEVYRTAVGEYGAPKEMLTDNGRQYASWRGKTRFQQELQKDRVHHIRSQPHHPQTLGKIERFWKTIWDEFLGRAQFETFESARERIRLWVQYYNHKRPHQSLEGLCPADRFFAIQKPMREALERGMQENLLELALRGQPKSPFYMVGRMGEQSLVMKVEEGQIKMVVDGQEDRPVKEMSYEIGGKNAGGTGEERADRAQRAGEVPGGALAMDGAATPLGSLPGVDDSGEPAEQLAGTGDGGYAGSLGTADASAGGPGPDARAEDGKTAGPQDGAVGEPDRAAGDAKPAGEHEAADFDIKEWTAERSHEEAGRGQADASRVGGLGGSPDGEGRGGNAGDLPKDLLPMGSTGSGSAAPCPDTGAAGPTREEDRSAEYGIGRTEPPIAGGTAAPSATGADPEPAG